MKAIIQRVSKAQVTIDDQIRGKISEGLLIFIGIAQDDSMSHVIKLANKILSLRIFNDINKKMNLSIHDIQGSLLIISQFTLYADCKNGNRPSFINAASPVHAKKIYNEFVTYMTNQNIIIQTGSFGAHMEVALINDGPVTLILDTQKNEKK